MREKIRNIFQKSVVFFDVDSTLVKIEGLDALGRRKNIGEQVANLTKRAMNGELPNEQVMEGKMRLLSPSQKDMATLAQEYLANMVDDAPEVVHYLQKAGISVGIITGNFHPAVDPLAKALGIKRRNVYANPMYFDAQGNYRGYDQNHPLINKGGKAKVVQQLRSRYKSITMVGDAKTDLETKPYVNIFIGFGEVERRSIVENEANIYVASESLAPVLLYVLPRRALQRMAYAPLIQKARLEDKKTLSHMHL
jgi:phosphoserine phosphatase